MFFIKEVRLLSLVLAGAMVLTAGAGIFFFGGHRTMAVPARDAGTVEIFDMGKGEVVKRLQSGRAVRRQAERLIGNISGLYRIFKPFPEKGIIIRIPLDPALEIRNKNVTGNGIHSADTLYLIFPDGGGQYLMLLDDGQRPWFYVYKGDAGVFSKYKP